jgi:ubiquinone/menaquinone biosynthesis C-methylase UbiE
MIPIVLLSIAVLLIIISAVGSPRTDALRRPGVEGIDDLDAARAYDMVSRWPQFRLLRRLIAAKLAKNLPTGLLADIGCGPGYLTTLIAKRYPSLRIVGVDAADEMIRAAEANAAQQGISDRVEYRQGDVGRLPLNDAELDFAISTLSLHHWSDPASAFDEVCRVLKPGGRMMLFDLRRDARRLVYWLFAFVQAAIVPAGLRRINEPMGSLLSSYALSELESMLSASRFEEWHVEGGVFWMFVWASKR